jgi:calcineurin-like phosphoesterase family protein
MYPYEEYNNFIILLTTGNDDHENNINFTTKGYYYKYKIYNTDSKNITICHIPHLRLQRIARKCKCHTHN